MCWGRSIGDASGTKAAALVLFPRESPSRDILRRNIPGYSDKLPSKNFPLPVIFYVCVRCVNNWRRYCHAGRWEHVVEIPCNCEEQNIELGGCLYVSLLN